MRRRESIVSIVIIVIIVIDQLFDAGTVQARKTFGE